MFIMSRALAAGIHLEHQSQFLSEKVHLQKEIYLYDKF